MAFNNTTNLSAIVLEIWSARFYEVLHATLPFLDSISTDWTGDIRALGDTLNISQISDFSAASELAEGNTGVEDTVTTTNIQLLINKRTYKDFQVTNEALLQSLPFVDSLREKAVYAINKRIQAVIIAAFIPSAAAPDHQLSYTTPGVLALVDILNAKKALDEQNVAMENRYMTLGSSALNDLFNINYLMSRDYIPSGSPLTSGNFDNPICGFTVRFTTEAGATSYFHHKDFMTMAMQQELTTTEHDLRVLKQRGKLVTSDILWGLKLLDNKRCVTIA